MRRCSVKPYEGNDKYIFVSYCHKDKKYIFPIVEQLARSGYRVWYDEGIDPGSEWPEIIASHLNGSAVCVAFISKNSLNSHNCRREINFALLKKKPFISIVIEPVELSLGMEMQLSATQSIFKYTLSSDTEFFSKFYEASCLIGTQGKPNLSIIVSRPADYDEDNIHGLFEEKNITRNSFSDRWFLEEKTIDIEEDKKDVKIDEIQTVEKEDVVIPEPPIEKKRQYVLIREKTNETIVLPEGEFKIGRSNAKSDYVITGNSGIGRLHAKIIFHDDQYFVADNKSLNKTFLNSVELEPEKEYPLKNGDTIRLMNEKFIFQQEEE